MIKKVKENPNIRSILMKRCDISDELLSNELGESIKNSQKLSHLTIQSCNLTDVSIANICLGILQSESLVSFSMKKNNIDNSRAKTIAAGLSGNKVLTELNLDNNDIRSVGCEAISLALADNQSLTSLYLSKNRIDDIGLLCQSVSTHSLLRYLNLEANNINNAQAIHLQHMLRRNHVLEELNLARNNISDEGIHYLSLGLARNFGLLRLILSRNTISDKAADSFAFALRHNNTLEVLDISDNNGITALGAQNIHKGLVENVSMLEFKISIIDSSPIMQDIQSVLSKNQMRKEGTHPDCYPSSENTSIDKVRNHRSLIVTLADHDILYQVFSLNRLTTLDLSKLSLRKLPVNIIHLHTLKVLDLRSNQLERLDPCIGILRYLEVLKLSDNNLQYLPYELESLQYLHELHIWGNPLTQIPNHSEIFGTKESFHHQSFHDTPLVNYLRYLKSCNQEKVVINKAKLMIVGNEKVGKTTLLQSLIHHSKQKSFSDSSSSNKLYEPHLTDGITITDVDLYDKTETKFSLSAWDFAGQDVYLTTHVFFLSQKTLYFVVFNLKEDLNNMEKVDYWIKSILSRAGKNVAIVLIGTHLESCKLDKKQVAEIQTKLVKKYVNHVVNDVLLVDSKKSYSKYMNIVCKKILKLGKVKGYFGKVLPKSYASVERRLRNIKKDMNKQILPYKQFEEIVLGCGVTKEEYIRIKDYLNQMGSILHFDTDERLREIVFIDPSFLCKIFADVISMKTQKSIAALEGIMPKRIFDAIWMEYDKKMQESFIRLLEAFEIAIPDYSKPEHDRPLLIPSLLPENPPLMIRNYWNTTAPILFQRIYVFKFLPYGFIDKLIVRLLQIRTLDIPCFWVNGLIARRNSESAKVEFEPKQFKLHVHVYGYEDSFLFIEIIECVRGLIEAWFLRCEPKVLIPLDKGFVELGELASLIRKGESHYKSGDKSMPLQVLAPDLMLKNLDIIPSEDLKDKVYISAGGFGKVYSATYMGESVAIKETLVGESNSILHQDDENGLSLQILQELLHEAKIMSQLSKAKHANLVQLKGLVQKPLGIVMEYVDGQNLYSFLKDHGNELTWSQKIKILLDIALGMDFLHRQRPPIVHGDLRSPNILITKSGDQYIAKISDFGLSAQIYNKIGITQSQSFEWQAPEVFMDRGYTHQSDIYSYAMIIWQIWKGSHIMPFEKERSYFSHHRDVQRAIDKKSLRPRIPVGNNPPPGLRKLETLVQECWDGNPENRPDFNQIIKDLLSIALDLNLDISNNAVNFNLESQWSKYETQKAVKTWQEKKRIDFKSEGGQATDFDYMHAHKKLWIGYSHSIVKVYDMENDVSKDIYDLTREYFIMAPSPSVQTLYNRNMEEKKIIALICFENRMWCVSERKEISVLNDHQLFSTIPIEEKSTCFIRNDALGYIGLENGSIYVIDLNAPLNEFQSKLSEILIRSVHVSDEPITSISVFNDHIWITSGKKIITVCRDTYSVLYSFDAHNGIITSLAVCPDIHHMWTCSEDNLVKVWNIETILKALDEVESKELNVVNELDEKVDQEVIKKKITEITPIKIFRQNQNKVTSLVVCGDYILSGGDTLTIWDSKTFSINRIYHHDGKVKKVVVIDEDTVVTLSVDVKPNDLFNNALYFWKRS